MPIRVGVSVVALALALAGVGWPRSAFGQDKSGPESAFHSQVDLVSVYFTVRDDKKRLASDLAQDKFSVSEDGQPQAIKFFAHHSDVVLTWACSWTPAPTCPGFWARRRRPRRCS